MKKLYICLFMFIMACAPAMAGAAGLEVQPACSNKDSQIMVDVVISESNVYAGSFNLVYDTALLEPVQVIKGDNLSGFYSSSVLHYKRSEKYDDTVRLNWSGTAKSLPDGVICTVVFDVLTDKTITGSVFVDEVVLCDYDGKSVEVTSLSGKIYLNGQFINTEIGKDGQTSVMAKIEIINAGKSAINTEMYIAVYSAGDVLKEVKKFEYSVDAGKFIFENNTIGLAANTDYAKALVWEKGTLVPLLEAIDTK